MSIGSIELPSSSSGIELPEAVGDGSGTGGGGRGPSREYTIMYGPPSVNCPVLSDSIDAQSTCASALSTLLLTLVAVVSAIRHQTLLCLIYA